MSFAGLAKTIGSAAGAFGSQPKLKGPRFQGITTPSLSLSPKGDLTRTDQAVPQGEDRLFGLLAQNRGGIQATAGLRSRLDPLRQRTSGFFDRTAGLEGQLRGQLDELRPGFGRITESRVRGVRNAASQATGNLRTSLQKRNIAGSSFANRQISNIQQSFAEEEDKVRAEAVVQEFQAQDQIINEIGNLLKLDQNTLAQEAGIIAQELGINQSEFTQQISNIQQESAVLQGRISRELNELGISGSIITKVQNIASQMAIAEAKFAAQMAEKQGESFQGFGEGLGSLFGGTGLATDLGGLFGKGGAGASGAGAAGAAGGAGLALSDIRMKKNIREVGKLDNGLTVYAYQLKSGGPTQIGVMAQDVETTNADAVIEIDGIKHVNYDLAVV